MNRCEVSQLFSQQTKLNKDVVRTLNIKTLQLKLVDLIKSTFIVQCIFSLCLIYKVCVVHELK